MKHMFEFLSGGPCTNAQEKDIEVTACASDIARAVFPNMRVAMLMSLDSSSSSSSSTAAACLFQMCDPSDVFVQPTTFAVVDLSAFTLKSCAKQGLVRAGKWVLAATGREWANVVMRAAAKGGHLEFAKWALAEGCAWGCNVMSAAARGGHLEFAQWAHAQGCEWGDDVLKAAADGGHVEFAKWVRSEGCTE